MDNNKIKTWLLNQNLLVATTGFLLIVFLWLLVNSITAETIKNSEKFDKAILNTYKDCQNCPLLEMIKVPRGSFIMGDKKYGYFNESPVHEVDVDYDFEVSRYEVTNQQFIQVMGYDYSYFRDCSFKYNYLCGVESVSWYEAQLFLEKLNRKSGKSYRLLTEAEWEYVCRAGSYDAYCGGGDYDKVGWFATNSGKTTHKVGQKAPNAWGVYDMSGNVWEWVQDNWHDHYHGAPNKGNIAWESNDENRNVRVLRGGAWDIDPNIAHATNRLGMDASMKLNYFGFRIARTL